MYIDNALLFSDDQAITTSAASTKTVDLGAIDRLGAPTDLYFNVMVTTAFSSDTETLTVDLCETEDGADAGSAAESILTLVPATAVSALTQGVLYSAKLPETALSGDHDSLSVYYTANGTLASGKVTAWISLGRDEKTAS